jgi:hypothetical protein
LSSPAARILETALALQRDPGERFRLRERALPDGLTHVLEVASGAPTAVRDAAETLGESEKTVLDAARFYLEQILFASPDADAYRILGVAPRASVEEIRTHHRWLQRWLHPDRAQAGDASVFATRVNQAWAQLRTPEMRHEYDVRLAEARMAGASAPFPAARIRRWEFEDAVPAQAHRSRWLLFAALASCAVLAVLVLRHEESVEPWDQPTEVEVAHVDATPVTESVEDHSPLEAALATSRSLPTDRIPTVGATEVATPRPPQPAPAPVTPPHRQATLVAASAAPTPRIPTPAPRTRLPAARLPTVGATEVATAPPTQRPAARLPTVGATEVATARPAQRPAARLPTVGATEVATARPTQRPLSQLPPPSIPAPPPSQDTALLLERMRKAEQRVAQLTAYLAAEPRAAPLWNDVQTQAAADRVRERIAAGDGGRLNLASPNWSMQPDDATLSVDYQCGSCRVPKGRLNVKLVWRQGLWLVRGVDLAPSA